MGNFPAAGSPNQASVVAHRRDDLGGVGQRTELRRGAGTRGLEWQGRLGPRRSICRLFGRGRVDFGSREEHNDSRRSSTSCAYCQRGRDS